MKTSDLKQLLSEKGNPCISILVSTHRYSKDRMKNPVLIERAIQKAKGLLKTSPWSADKKALLESKLGEVRQRIDFMRLQEALAIYISPNVFQIIPLPFSVKEKVVLGKTFEIRDALYFNQLLQPYYLLAISRKKTRLMRGEGRDLQEVINNDFPKQYVEEYEYEHPSIGSSSLSGLKSFEGDKSVMQDNRLHSFMRQADHLLDNYVKEGGQLFIAGIADELDDFERITNHLKNVAGKIPGNYDHDALHPLGETAWQKIKDAIKSSHDRLIAQLREDIGKDLAAEGIREVWRTASEGRGHTLLVEKDYEVKGYRNPENESAIHLSPPVAKYDVVPDAADEVIGIVLEKGGKVVVVENGDLAEVGHIALMLRYPK